MPESIRNEESSDGIVKVYENDGKKLFMEDLTNRLFENGVAVDKPVATWGSPESAVIDKRVFEILKEECGDDIGKLNSYLDAILNFEINFSDNAERHLNRLPIEAEILEILKKRGYLD